jgi:hypothetical protein
MIRRSLHDLVHPIPDFMRTPDKPSRTWTPEGCPIVRQRTLRPDTNDPVRDVRTELIDFKQWTRTGDTP